MDRESGRKLAQALLVGAFLCILCPSGQPLAQENAAPAAASGATPVEAATQTRKDRRRAAKTDATDATAKVDSGTDAAATEEPERVCKNIKPLGTRMAKRVCGTPEQWAALEKKTTDAASDDLRHVRSTGGVIATTPGPASTP
jgi:hypothetical protein